MNLSPPDYAVDIIRSEMARMKELVPRANWYLFGSITGNKRPVSDIDLLVVCESSADCARIRSGLTTVCTEFPIHLLLMTRAEEVEINFIKGERAIEIDVTDDASRKCAYHSLAKPRTSAYIGDTLP